MIVKCEMIYGKLYFMTVDGRIYRVTNTVGDVVEKLADITQPELDQMMRPQFLKFVDRF